MSVQPLNGTEDRVYVAKASEFNAFAEASGEQPVDLKAGEAMVIYYTNAIMGDYTVEPKSAELAAGITLEPIGSQPSVTLLFAPYYVIPDETYDRLEHLEMQTIYAFDVEEWKQTEELGRTLSGQLSGNDYRLLSVAHELAKINQDYGIVLFIGLFIGAVFFVASGSFLYFRLYADMPDDKEKFKSITKLGLTERELSGIVTKQLMILFFVPIVVAFVHGAVALTAMQNMFGYSLVKTSMTVLGTFMLIQLVYFLLIRFRYVREVSA